MAGSGVLEVTLIDARGLANTDFLKKMDPYVIAKYKGQEHKSQVARGQGKTPVWNERFTFRVDYPGADDQYKLLLKIMDKDSFTSDDFVGQAIIPLGGIFELGMESMKEELVHPTRYRVTLADGTYHGDIKVAISFIAKIKEAKEVETYGRGWPRHISH